MSEIIIIGAWNTGTNLIWNILSNSRCINKTTNTEVIIQSQHYKLWKHEPQIIKIRNLIKNNPDSIIIIMYRNILNWISSMLKESYEVKFKDLNSIVCVKYNNNNNICFRNIISLYSTYYSNYKTLMTEYKNVIFLNYNKIINAEKSFDYINSKLIKYNLILNSYDNFIEVLNKPSKCHGKSVSNYLEALKKIDVERKRIKNLLFQKYPKLIPFLNVANEIEEYYENE